MIDIKYELLHGKYISLMVTELGLYPLTAVTSILKEFKADFEKIAYSD